MLCRSLRKMSAMPDGNTIVCGPLVRDAFEGLAARVPDDPVVAMHLRRIREGQIDTELGRQGE